MGKKTNGFTLIELLAVVTIIALISVIAIPNILKGINDKKTEISDTNMKLLEAAANMYIENHKNEYASTFEADGSTYCITLQTLVNNKLLTTPFKNIKGEEIDYSQMLEATYDSNYNTFTYNLVENNACTEKINYVNKPILADNMIPVIYNENNNTWEKADVNSKWYNYKNKKWANAVLVREYKSEEENSKSRYEYNNAPAGTTILESDILAQFVWIPRFKYQLFNSDTPTEIKIIFENIATNKSQGNEIGQWLTHPAFTYKNQELSGIWVGKYEASNKENNIVIKNNATPWTNIGYNDATSLADSMINSSNIYGLDNVNTHLIQNNEWSAVTYLTQSSYGLNDKVNINSSTTTGGTNSTTGNNYGIYDMAGLSKEFVTVTGENEESIGYSLGETKNWYGETNSFINYDNPYLVRGTSSIFNYSASNVKNTNTSFRPIIINNSTSSSEQNTSLQYAYLNISTNSYYSTLRDALSEAHNGDTVKVLGNVTDSSVPTIDEGKTLTLEIPNEYTIALSGHYIDNDGTLIVKGNGTLTSTLCAIRNDGTLNIQEGISINGTGSTSSTINNFGTMTVTNATITSDTYRAIYNQATGTLVVSGNNTNITAYNYAIHNINTTANSTSNPAVKIEGGTITSSNNTAINNAEINSMVYVSGGIIRGERGISNQVAGNIYITGTPTITGTKYQAIRGYNGNVTVKGGTTSGPTINGYTDGVYITTANEVSGNAQITGYVNIIGQNQYGIQATGSTSLTIGVKDSTVSTTYPYIVSNGATGMNGVHVKDTGTFNFYDGKITREGIGAINRDPDDVPTGYKVVRTTEGTKQAVTLGVN